MIIRKPGFLFATFNDICSIQSNLSGSSTSLKRKRESRRPCIWCRREPRNYATIASDEGQNDEQNDREQHAWPKPLSGQAHPTPYQIFEMKTNGVYSKARFYELVKVYHPDRGNGKDEALPRHIKMERYRLIVAANHILADPTKRSAYDRFGAGWNGRAEVGGKETWYQPSPHHPPGPFSSWTDSRNPIWQNATWEDLGEVLQASSKRERNAYGRCQTTSQIRIISSKLLLLASGNDISIDGFNSQLQPCTGCWAVFRRTARRHA